MKSLLFLNLFLFVCGQIPFSSSPRKHPYALLTEDYGVLTEQDLKISEFQGYPQPFNETVSPAYPYWQCFPKRQVTLKCRSWPDDQPGKFLGEADIEIAAGKEHHGYGFRRAWDIEFCQKRLNKWNQLAKGEEVICLSGEYAGLTEKIIAGKKNQSTCLGLGQTED